MRLGQTGEFVQQRLAGGAERRKSDRRSAAIVVRLNPDGTVDLVRFYAGSPQSGGAGLGALTPGVRVNDSGDPGTFSPST